MTNPCHLTLRQTQPNVKVSDFTIDFLGEAIAGDLDEFPYLSGPQLVKFFNGFGARDVYPMGGGFPTRRVYAQDKISELNGTTRLDDALCAAVHPRKFVNIELQAEDAVARLNQNLKFDGFQLVLEGLEYKVRSTSSGNVSVNPAVRSPNTKTQAAIDESIRKSESKLSEGDYSGAITNARTLVEASLTAIEQEIAPEGIVNDGDLVKQYKRVQKLLNLAPDRTDIDQSLKQVLNGLTSVVNGIAAVRNKMSDSHASSFPAEKHHAQLVVHAAATLANFLFDSKQYQQSLGRIPASDAGET